MRNLQISIFLSVLLTGCATMFVHTNDRVVVRSDNKAAKLYLNGRYLGKGSGNAKVPKYGSYTLFAKQKGCLADSRPIDRTFYPGWFLFGNCLLNGCFGIFVDLITGAYRGLDQNNYVLNPNCDS